MALKLMPLLTRLTIQPKEQGLIPLRPNSSQRRVVAAVEEQYNAGKPVRILGLKARQVGFSTVTEAIMFAWCYLFRPTRGFTLAHEKDTARALLEMVDNFWAHWPFRALDTLRYATKSELVWGFHSSLRIGTAERPLAPRGKTIQAFHGSEVAYWRDPKTLMKGLRQSIPNHRRSLIILESTANGVGDYFHSLWTAAEAGDVEYEPIFVPWFEHEEYFLADFPPLRKLSAEERTLRKAFGLSDAQLAWRRWALKNLVEDEESFRQEYPATPEEAFVSTGSNIFHLSDLQLIYEPLTPAVGYLEQLPSGEPKFVSDAKGPLKIFKKPSRYDYIVAGDPTYTTQGDPAVIQVLNRVTYEQVAVWEGHIDPISFATPLRDLARYYNNALVTCEIEGPGYGTVGRLIEIYPRVWQHQWADKMLGSRRAQTYGWSSSYKRKEWAIAWLRKLVRDRSATIHDVRTFSQMKSYGITNRGLGNMDAGGHDDHVMSLAIAIVCSVMEGPVVAPNIPGATQMAAQAIEELEFEGLLS